MEPAFEFTADKRAKAIRLLERENQKEEHKRRVEELKRQPHIHPIIWKVMRHQDREEFVSIAEAVESKGSVPLAMLAEKVLMPGKASVSSSVHEYMSAQKRLAVFAKGVHSASESYCNVVHDFLSELASSDSAVSSEVRAQAEEVSKAFAEIMNAIDLRVHVPNVSTNSE